MTARAHLPMGKSYRNTQVSDRLSRPVVSRPPSRRRGKLLNTCHQISCAEMGKLAVIVCLVVRRHYTGETIEDIRTDIKRTEDVHRTALTLTEYIEKEGDELWADNIVQMMGPWLMVQLCDIANSLEVMRKSVHSRLLESSVHSEADSSTASTSGEYPAELWQVLGILVVAILLTTFTPAGTLLKCATFSAGLTFFGLFPLATNFPEYRLLASIPKRIFWNIPTHCE